MAEINLEIIENQNDVTYKAAQVEFPAYEDYKNKALTVAEYISSLSVTEDNIKETKQTLAKARKLTDKLNRARIDMKKDILQNYTKFESQVKEIVGIVDQADAELRSKVREMDEAERDRKKEAIRDLWKKRTYAWPMLEEVIPDAFDRWLSPKHLNKTASMKSVETDMTEWIDKTMKEIDAAAAMGDEYLVTYACTGDLTETVRYMKEREKTYEHILGAKDETKQQTAVFIVIGKKDIELADRLLTENTINYERKDQ